MISFMVFSQNLSFHDVMLFQKISILVTEGVSVLTDAAYRKLHNTLSLLVFQVVV